jgi:4-amino-4-deoxy-L-arabinose transferase-like glycosyltransferase
VTAPARIRLPVALVVAVILAGALQRWWVAAHPMGTLTSDGAVIGLMALRLLHHGHLTAYMWGQSYGGSVEAIITAAVFGVAGSGTSQLLAATALSSALAALALWRAGRWILGETAAQIGALIFWVWPATFLWRSLKPGGTYMAGLAIALCAVGALARIRRGDDDGWRRCAIAGLWCGLALWSTPMGLELLIPAGLWCLPAVRRLGFRLLAFGAGAAAGWLPALVFGLTHDWTNLHMPGERADLLSGALSRFRQFFRLEAPIAMGVRAEGSFAWVGGHFGEFLAWPGAAALLATAVAVLARRAPRCVLPVLTLVLLPFLYAFIELADNPGQGRYALFAVPMAALLLGAGTERIAVLPRVRWPALAWTAVLALACGLGTAGLAAEPALALVALPAPDVPMPVSDAPLRTLLAEHGVTDAYATYWIAYRVMFETGGRVTVAPYDYDRYPPINAAVSASPDPAFLFVTASRTTGSFEAWCRAHGVAYQAWQLGGFTVVRPAVRVNPAQALPG